MGLQPIESTQVVAPCSDDLAAAHYQLAHGIPMVYLNIILWKKRNICIFSKNIFFEHLQYIISQFIQQNILKKMFENILEVIIFPKYFETYKKIKIKKKHFNKHCRKTYCKYKKILKKFKTFFKINREIQLELLYGANRRHAYISSPLFKRQHFLVLVRTISSNL